jgi:hypothetical protein
MVKSLPDYVAASIFELVYQVSIGKKLFNMSYFPMSAIGEGSRKNQRTYDGTYPVMHGIVAARAFCCDREDE